MQSCDKLRFFYFFYFQPPLHLPPLLQLFVALAVVQSEATATVLDSACECWPLHICPNSPVSVTSVFVSANEYPQSAVILIW